MASRRTRLKAVVNLPVRRPREGDPSSSGVDEKLAADCPQNIEAHRPSKLALQQEEIKETDSGKNSDAVKTGLCADTPKSVNTEKNVRATKKEDKVVNLKASEHNPLIENGGRNAREILPTPKLTIPVRKRVKAIVSLAALTRKLPKEVGQGLGNENITKDVDDKNIIEPSSSAQEKCAEQLDTQKTSSVAISDSLTSSKIQREDDDTISLSSQTSFDGFLPAQSSLNAKLPSKLHTDNSKLSSTKVLSKLKSVTLTPRLVDSSNRRSNQSGVEDPLKVLPSIQNVTDSKGTRSIQMPTQQTVSETDDEVETSSQYSFSAPQINQPLGKNTTAPSVASTVYEDNVELDDSSLLKAERRPQSHRRPRKSGVGEILTVARRDFYKKFGSNIPDKKQLTMFDLIFYNPTSNPMKHENKQKFTDEKPTESKQADAVTERIAEESVDDVDPLGDEESTAMPAPQVKVGPDGSLIIDEKSLVIATTGSQKRKYELANSSVVVDYGLGNATYNSFSKKVKPKEWSKKETLKFYRALQSVGTDFLLMQSIFPTRSRGDLKQKYKKEDRMNRDLVDKALGNPLEFDLTALEKELEQEGKENEEKEKEKRRLSEQKQNTDDKKKEKGAKKRSSRRKGLIAISVMDDIASHNIDDEDCGDIGTKKPEIKPKKKRKAKKTSEKSSKRKRLESDSSTSNDEESDINQENVFENTCINGEKGSPAKNTSEDETSCDSSDEDQEQFFLQKSPQPTRYGRVPRPRSLSKDAPISLDQQDDQNGSDELDGNIDNYDTMQNVASLATTTVTSLNTQPSCNVTSLKDVEPGSLVILSTPGQKTLQLFMVAPKSQNSTLTHIPVAVTPEILASVNSNIGAGLESPENTSSIDYIGSQESNLINEDDSDS